MIKIEKLGRKTMVMAAIFLGLVDLSVFAHELDGGSAAVNPGDIVESWVLKNGSVLIVNPGGKATDITAYDSIVTLTGALVEGSWSGNVGIVNLYGGTTSKIIDAKLINRAGRGLALAADSFAIRHPSASVYNSNIIGLQFGASVASGGILNLSSTSTLGLLDTSGGMYDGGTGLGIFNGHVNIGNYSIVSGDRNGILIFDDGSGGNDRTVVVDESIVEGKTGAAIKTVGYAGTPTVADVAIVNGSRLKTGNANLFEVDQYSAVAFVIDNSILEGDIAVEKGGLATVALRNNAQLTGKMNNVSTLALSSGAIWRMNSNDVVANLIMDDGILEMGGWAETGFQTLTVDTLVGYGTFLVGADLSVPEGDKLVISREGGAHGVHRLQLKSSGRDPSSENALTVVKTNGGDAKFSLVGDVVERGVYKYYLYKVDENWELRSTTDNPREPKYLSESTKAVVSLHATAAAMWYTETDSLRYRMAGFRSGERKWGPWGRGYMRHLKEIGAAKVEFENSIQGLMVGADHAIDLTDGCMVLGIFGGHSNSTVKRNGRSTGSVRSSFWGGYAKWLHNNGMYIDGLFKVNRFENDVRVVMSDKAGASGMYSATGLGGQIGIGKTYNLRDDLYAESFAQVAVLHIDSFRYALNNGMSIDSRPYRSVQGRMGMTLSYSSKLRNGGLFRPYIRFALAREFVNSNELMINTVTFNNSFNGMRGEVATGFFLQLDNSTQIRAEIDASAGRSGSRSWGGSVGVHYRF